MGVRVEINKDAVRARIEAANKKALYVVSEQALGDCNYYCRVDQGTLRDSSERSSDLKNGQLVWDTPYAKRVYYTGSPSHDINPNASLMWCEVAQNQHGKDWEKVYEAALRDNL